MSGPQATRLGSPRLRGARPTRLACLVLILGVLVAVAGSMLWRGQAERQLSRSLSAEATGVQDAVITSIERMDDLAADARALVGTDADLSNRGFSRWYRLMDAGTRYRGVNGLGFIRFVSPRELPGFLAELRRDPPTGVPRASAPLSLPSTRAGADYCLLRYAVASRVNALLPAGLDLCGVPGFDILTRARDSGSFYSFTLGGRVVALFAPVYRGGTDPGDRPARRARALGVVAELFDGRSLLAAALAGHHDLQLSISRRDLVPSAGTSERADRRLASALGGLSQVISVGRVDEQAFSSGASFVADGRWGVRVAAAAGATGVHPDRQTLVVFIALLLVSVLAAALVQALAHSRTRALTMVRERTAQLRHMALHDALTGLPNRSLLMERAEELLRTAESEGRWVAAIYIDVDGFKGVNDSLGHAAGDRLLQVAGRRIASSLRTTDIVGRIGGDEFVVVAAALASELSPEALAERLQSAFREPFRLVEGSSAAVRVTVSLGLAVGSRPRAEDLLRDADIALYQAKQQGRNRCVVFRRNMQVALQERVSMESDLRGARERGEMRIAYQPILDLHGERVRGLEALMRWDHPERGPVPPGMFIPIAEESDLIVELGAWVLEEACRQCAAWHRMGRTPYVAVNVAARQLQDPGLVETVRRCLDTTGLPPEYLMLEITETAIMRDAEAAAGRLVAVSNLGVRVAIDDFGTGYSSLAYLHSFDVDALKIDRTFVSNIGSSEDAEALIGALVALAASLGIETVAEGIESDAQREFLVARGCTTGQGFLFSRPVSARDLEPLLARSASREARSAAAGQS